MRSNEILVIPSLLASKHVARNPDSSRLKLRYNSGHGGNKNFEDDESPVEAK